MISLAVLVVMASLAQTDATPNGDELIKMLAETPKDLPDRENRFAEMLRKGAGAAKDVELCPLKIDVQRQLGSLEPRLREMGQSALDVAAILEMERPLWSEPQHNVIARIQGSGDRILVLCANLDPAGKGVLCNWTGCAMVAKLAQALRQEKKRTHQLWCVGFAAQGLGCVGSRQWLASLKPEEVARIDAVIDLECLGMDDPALWADNSSMGLRWVARKAARELGFEIKVRDYENLTLRSGDLAVFHNRKLQTLFIEGVDPARAYLLEDGGVEAIEVKVLDKTFRFLRRLVLELDAYTEPVTAELLQKNGVKKQEIDSLLKVTKVRLATAPPPAASDEHR